MNVQPIKRTFAPTTVIVSRVQRFYDYPSKIFPVSCTNVVLEDTYFDDDLDEHGYPIYEFYETIAGSKVYVSKVLKGNAGVVVDLSKIRPKGTPGSNGMMSAGVRNFMAGYSSLNLEIRRGSAFRNGAVVLQLDADHPDLEDFLECTNQEIPWAKRGVTVGPGWMDQPYYPLIEKALAEGKIFLYKQQYNNAGEKLSINVCQGICFKSRSTCTLAHINLGLIKTHQELTEAFINGAHDLNTIWEDFFNAWDGYYGEEMGRSASHFLNPEDDKQVGLGVLGLSNMLVNFGVKYSDFSIALNWVVDQQRKNQLKRPDNPYFSEKAYDLACAFQSAYLAASRVFKQFGFERAFTIEPTATCSYKQVDYNGYTTSPEISPPIAHPLTKSTRRVADQEIRDYQYPPNVEVAGHDVTWVIYDLLCDAWQKMMENTGLAQCISYNWWLSKPVNRTTLYYWNQSPLKTVYYRWKETTDDADKTSIGVEVTEESANFWGSEEPEGEAQPVICQLNSESCTSCGE